MNSQQLLAQIGDMPWSKVLVYGVIALSAYYFMMYDDGSALQNQLQTSATALSQSRAGLEQTKKAMADADKFEREVKSIGQQFERIRDFMPENQSAASLTEVITKQASVSGAKLTKLEPKPINDKVEFYETTKIDISLDGSYPQLVSFLSHLSRVPKLMTFDKIQVIQTGGEPDKPVLAFKGTLVGYRYIAPREEKKGTDAAQPAGGGATDAPR